MLTQQSIGIFDSGVGGLTVYHAIRKAFPHEDLVYFGDTARVPYGPKSKRTVIDYSIQNTRFLLQQHVKIIVVACNTSSAVAMETLKEITDIPVIGVITPGAEAAVKATKNKKIGVIGTYGTVRSQAYTQAILGLMPDAQVYSQQCPLFVPLAEEGWEDHAVTIQIAQTYLQDIMRMGIDTLVLGCTHYPILKRTIQKVVGPDITLVDSADAIIPHLLRDLPDPRHEGLGKDSFFVSDNEAQFMSIAQRILDDEPNSLRKVRLGESWYVDYSNSSS
jgi:glutamate racemase